MNPPRTVTVEPLSAENVLRMTWQKWVTEEDVYAAFKIITTALVESQNDLFVIVDLRNNPNFPLNATVTGALYGPYRNPRLKEWLIIGSNSTARLIARLLNSISRRDNIHWFNSEDEALAYLATLQQTAPDQLM